MTPTRVAAVLIMLMAGILGVFLISARAITYEYDGQNRVTALYLDDGTWIQYTYDANGNRTAKTYYNQFFALMASSGAGGTVSPPSASVIYGANQTFTISPATGYYITDVSVDGASVGVVTSYTFTNVTASHVIQASFAIYTYPITTSVIGGGGSISPSSATVNYGAGQAFAITPSTGYYITNVIVDGSSVGAVAGYTFTNVTAAHTIEASFAIDTYSITTSAVGSGGISPTSAIVDFGGGQTFAITPAQGFATIDAQVDGVSQGPISSYTFTDVSANHTLSANFTQNGPVKNTRTNITYPSLQAAYNAASDADIILIQSVELTENFNANRNIWVTIDGGYNSDYSANPGTTTIQGAPVISSGAVTMEDIVISK